MRIILPCTLLFPHPKARRNAGCKITHANSGVFYANLVLHFSPKRSIMRVIWHVKTDTPDE